jgi:hypothetical protein
VALLLGSFSSSAKGNWAMLVFSRSVSRRRKEKMARRQDSAKQSALKAEVKQMSAQCEKFLIEQSRKFLFEANEPM